MTNWSDYQNDIFDFIASPSNGSAVVDAKAGSGKTTTLVEGMNHIPFSTAHVLFLAFNKAIADELRHRVPEDVQARTFNSIGAEVVRKGLGVSRATPGKVNDIAKRLTDDDLKDDNLYNITRLVKAAKSSGVGVLTPTNPETLYSIAIHHNIVFPRPLEKKALQTAKRILEASYRDTKTIDFDDQLLFPLYYNLLFPSYELIFVDEAQDLNPIQHEFLSNLLKDSNSRIIAVGDPHQAIYAFRGADSNSLSNLAARFSCHQLPLSISYRCPRAVVREAQRYEPDIQAAPDAPEGEVRTLPQSELTANPPTSNQSLILCRANAPLISLAMDFLQSGRPVTVRSDFGRNFITWLERFNATTVPDFFNELSEWRDERIRFAEERDVPSIANRALETYEVVRAAARDAQSPLEIISNFERLLYEHPSAPILSTIHKAKGLEATDVYLLRPDLIPSKWASQEWEIAQEYNLLYVAITRAASTFTYVTSED